MDLVDSLPVRERPFTLKGFVGNKHVKDLIKGYVAQGEMPKVFRIAGPYGIGKTTLGAILGYTANCLNLTEDGHPCGECESCSLPIGAHPDISEINGAIHGGKDDVIKFVSKGNYKPTFKAKVFILDEAHCFSGAGKSALLVPLEKPPKATMWILCSSNPDKLDAALPSRCVRLDLAYPSIEELAKKLKIVTKRTYGQALAEVLDPFYETIVNGCGRQPRDSISVLSQICTVLASKKALIKAPDEAKILSIIDNYVASSSTLDDVVMNFIVRFTLKDWGGMIQAAMGIDHSKSESFYHVVQKHVLYAAAYLSKKKSKRKEEIRGFWGIDFRAWERMVVESGVEAEDFAYLGGCLCYASGLARQVNLAHDQITAMMIRECIQYYGSKK